jgi:hypothetical protein
MIHFNCPCCDAVPCAPDCTFSQDCPEQHADMLAVREALAVAQAQAARYRGALEAAKRVIGSTAPFGAAKRAAWDFNMDAINAALASPLDTSALDAVRADEWESGYERGSSEEQSRAIDAIGGGSMLEGSPLDRALAERDAIVRAEEREACAKVAEASQDGDSRREDRATTARRCAAAIRARGARP